MNGGAVLLAQPFLQDHPAMQVIFRGTQRELPDIRHSPALSVMKSLR